jgi:hypothetical protein
MKKRYLGQLIRQSEKGPTGVLFVAPAEQLRQWGGVPTKTSRFMRGFQRAQSDAHWQEISAFFEQAGNISPTAIVVAFRPGTASVKKVALGGIDWLRDDATIDSSNAVVIEIDVPDYSTATIDDLAAAVKEQLASYVALPPEEPEDDSDGSDAESDAAEDPTTSASEDGDLQIYQSHLRGFVDFLSGSEELAAAKADPDATAELRHTLLDLLKPGTVVDGQHRMLGASYLERGIPFPVVALLDASYAEQVFQFVVINQKAKPIKAEFLSAIISSSLSPEDIKALGTRLEQAGIDTEATAIMDRLQFDQSSPFNGMIDFKVPGAGGFLSYKGMLTLARRWKKLMTHDVDVTSSMLFKQSFQNLSEARTYAERRREWNEGLWFDYFRAFWAKVQDKLSIRTEMPHLWSENSNLIKIVTMQEMQNTFLSWLYRGMHEFTDQKEFESKVDLFLQNLRPDFFVRDWKLPSLQSGTGRQHLRKALGNAIVNSAYRFNDPLFNGLNQGSGG